MKLEWGHLSNTAFRSFIRTYKCYIISFLAILKGYTRTLARCAAGAKACAHTPTKMHMHLQNATNQTQNGPYMRTMRINECTKWLQ